MQKDKKFSRRGMRKDRDFGCGMQIITGVEGTVTNFQNLTRKKRGVPAYFLR